MKVVRSLIVATILCAAYSFPAAAQNTACAFLAQYGYVPTTAQWTSCLASKQDLLPFTPLSSGGGVLSGRLVILNPTTGQAPLNLLPFATDPTTLANGDVWFTSSAIKAQVGNATYNLLSPTLTSLNQLPAIGAGTVLANTGGSSAAPSAVAVGTLAANPNATAGPTAVNGSASTFMRSDAAPAVQLGSNSIKGIVQCDGTSITCSSGVISTVNFATAPTTSTFKTGSGTYTVPAGVKWIEVTLVGGGGGGGGGFDGTSGGAGGNTCWNTSGAACTTAVYQAGGGSGGANGNAGGTSGAAGGTVGGSGTCYLSVAGGSSSGSLGISSSAGGTGGGMGGNSSLGGAGGGGSNGGTGFSAAANSGSGGGGGGVSSTSTGSGGGGGGAGASCRAIITSPASSYTYAIGTAGSNGGAGTNANAGGSGGAGMIAIIEHYAF